MNSKEHIARFCCKLGRQLTGDRFKFELMDGPRSGKRIGGSVSWDGSGWHVLMSTATSDERFWQRSLHELGHAVLGHCPRVPTDAELTGEAIRGEAPVYAAKRMDGWGEGESLKTEAAAEAWGFTMAQLLEDELMDYLTRRGYRWQDLRLWTGCGPASQS